MALPAVAAKGAKMMGGAKKALGMLGMGQSKKKPYIFSPEGIIMLFFAAMVGIINIILSFLPGIDTVLAPIINVVVMVLIGGWLWFRTGTLPLKKTLLPFGLNSIPIPLVASIVSLVPYWFIAVWTSLEKKAVPDEESQETTEPQPQPTRRKAYAR